MKDACTCIPSGNECHCVKCCLNFGGERAFESHFGKGGEHLDPAVLIKKDGTRLLKPLTRQDPQRVVWVRDVVWSG